MKPETRKILNRASILGFLGAALVANVAATDELSYDLDAELRAHLRDALKPLGFNVKSAANRHAPHIPTSCNCYAPGRAATDNPCTRGEAADTLPSTTCTLDVEHARHYALQQFHL